MSPDNVRKNWRRWREAIFATCTVWLVLQNVVLFSIVAWSKPASALAAGAAFARSAMTATGPALVLLLAVALGVALAAWLVQAPGTQATERIDEVNHDV
jgi:hypothetical protein